MSIVTIITVVSLTVGIGKLFDSFINNAHNKKIKNFIFDLWKNLNNYTYSDAIRATNNFSLQIFEIIYGEKYFGVKAFFRSILMSILFMSISIILTFIFLPDYTIFKMPYSPDGTDTFELLYKSMLILIGYNMIIDYLSVIQTRFFLKSTSQSGLGKIFFLIIADILITGLLFIIPWEIISDRDGVITELIITSESNLSHSYSEILLVGRGDPKWLTGFISTYSTSLIFYIFFVFSTLLKLLTYFKFPLTKLLDFLYSSERPITTLVSMLSAILIIIESFRKLFE